MIRCYIPVDQRNKKRVWPCKAVSGIVISVPCDRITMTREDLSSHVLSGLLNELEPIQEPDIDQPVAVSEGGVLASASDVIEVVAPVVVAEVVPVVDTVVVPENGESLEVAVEAEADASGDAASGLDAMSRSELWALIVSRGLDGGAEYRSTTKSKMISILTEG